MEMVSLFSGGGLADIGCRSAGYTPVGAVEFDPAIAAVYARHHGEHVMVASVDQVDYRQFAGVRLGWLSPVCTNASTAQKNKGEKPADEVGADGCIRFIREARPAFIVVENVWGYRKFESFRRICDTLTECSYTFTVEHLNAADFGVPQTRKRLILRATRVGELAPLSPTHANPKRKGFEDTGLKPWNGWLASIADLVDGLPGSEFAPWQLKRLPAELQTLLVGGSNTSDTKAAVGVGVSTAEEPTRCVAPNGDRWKALLVAGNSNENSWGDNSRGGDEPAFCATQNAPGRMRAILTEGDSNRSGGPMGREGEDPAFTIQASHGRRPSQMPRALLIGDQRLQFAERDEPAFTARAAKSGVDAVRALIVDGQESSGKTELVSRDGAEPIFTVGADTGNRRVVRALMMRPDNTTSPGGVEGTEPSFAVTSGGKENGTRFAPRALIVHPNGTDTMPTREEGEPCFCVTTGGARSCGHSDGGFVPRALVPAWRVVTITPRALARFQTLPDSYWLPDASQKGGKALACRIIGNGVPCLFAEAIARSFQG